MKLGDEYFKKIAAQYILQDGEKLKEELAEIEEEKKIFTSMYLDKSILRKVKKIKLAGTVKILSQLAACILILVVSFRLVYNSMNVQNNTESDKNWDTAEEAAYPEESVGMTEESAYPDESTEMTEESMEESTDMAEDTAEETAYPEENTEVAENTTEGSAYPEGEIIPLSFTLPVDFTVENVKQDRGETIYYIAHAESDNIVMSLKKADGETDYKGLKNINIDNNEVFGIAKNDFSVIKFEKDNIVYTLSCQYDYNTLVELSKSIL